MKFLQKKQVREEYLLRNPGLALGYRDDGAMMDPSNFAQTSRLESKYILMHTNLRFIRNLSIKFFSLF